jgi:NAD(P)H-hydrate epimerase
MKILTAAQMREVDRISIEQLGIPGVELMENAGGAVTRVLDERFSPLAHQRIAILCGRGNNGGDGFVVARQLRMRGLEPRVVLLADPESIRGDARINYDLLVNSGCRPHVVRDLNGWLAVKPELLASTLVVDALLGTGLWGPVEGLPAQIIRDINASFAGIPMVAVDIPSGLPSDTGAAAGDSLRADITVTFTAPKVGQVLPPNCTRVGELLVRPIGTPENIYESRDDFYLNLITPGQLAPFVQPRAAAAHKGDFGHVLVVAGSCGKGGAAALTGQAALKAGAGLVTVATAQSALPVVAGFTPELMTEPLAETDEGSISVGAFEYGRFASVAQGKDVLAIGPGLTTHPNTVNFVHRVIQEFQLPAVLDADGLNAFAGRLELLKGHAAPLVITPHPGEMARLLGISTREVQDDRVAVARRLAAERGLFVILKGYRTLVAEPGGQVWVNPTGNPGMATGGTGDVLTGLVAGLMAQYAGLRLADVLCAAVYAHGRAGDLAVVETGEKALVATDLIRFLPQVWREISL